MTLIYNNDLKIKEATQWQQFCFQVKDTAELELVMEEQLGNMMIQNIINYKDIEKDESIAGQGNFGEVYRGLRRKMEVVAVKVLKLKEDKGIDLTTAKEMIKKEIYAIQKITPHSNVCSVFGVCLRPIGEDLSQIELISEWVSGGDLKVWLQKNKEFLSFKINSTTTGINILIDFGMQVACGMDHIIGCDVVHRGKKLLH